MHCQGFLAWYTVSGHLLKDCYGEMVADLYIETRDEVIIGCFLNNDLLPVSELGHEVKKKKNETYVKSYY